MSEKPNEGLRVAEELVRTVKDLPISTDPHYEVSGPLTPEAFADAFASLEGYRVRAVRMNPRDYADLRHNRDFFCILDFETWAPMLRLGVMGLVWSATVVADRDMPEGLFTLLGEYEDPQTLSIVPEKTATATIKVIR